MSNLQMEDADVQNNKAMGILAYILFFIPLLAARDSRFAMYHANQGLVLFLAGVIVNILGWVIPFLGPLLILPLGSLAVLALAIIGIINAAKGETRQLPLIGGFTILK
ncbi:hypothetical protein [Paenibacillus sp. y28]|uniref:hypothetical protein n=1 Tax=Paenibacillus sp. y28 TaxID=3129110 RepID=UPI003019EC19